MEKIGQENDICLSKFDLLMVCCKQFITIMKLTIYDVISNVAFFNQVFTINEYFLDKEYSGFHDENYCVYFFIGLISYSSFMVSFDHLGTREVLVLSAKGNFESFCHML